MLTLKAGVQSFPHGYLLFGVEDRDVILVPMDPRADRKGDADGRDDGLAPVEGLDLGHCFFATTRILIFTLRAGI